MEKMERKRRLVVSRSRCQKDEDRAEIEKLRQLKASATSIEPVSLASVQTVPGTSSRWRSCGDIAGLHTSDLRALPDSHKNRSKRYVSGRPDKTGPSGNPGVQRKESDFQMHQRQTEGKALLTDREKQRSMCSLLSGYSDETTASSSSGRSRTVSNPTPPQKTTLFIRINEVIMDMTALGEVLTSKMNTPGVELIPTESCIEWNDQFTFCSLTCDSKNQAKKLKDLLMKNKIASQPPRISCSFTPFRQEQGGCEEGVVEDQPDGKQTGRHDNGPLPKKDGDELHAAQRARHNQVLSHTKQKASSPQTDKVVANKQAERRKGAAKKEEDIALAKDRLKKQVEHELESRSEEVLKKHNLKAEEVKQKIITKRQTPQRERTSRYMDAEIHALESKLEELEKQEAEFREAIGGFGKKLDVVLGQEDYKSDIATLRKRLGLERYRLDKALPMYAHRRDIVELVQQHQVAILLAETGSGKSTQVVQYLLDAGIADTGTIVCTQPRKVAAITLATHVAQELATPVGGEVGYKVGNKQRRSDSTKVVYMTDHSLLNECLTDPDLKTFSCVVVDEAHERSLFTDLLLTMLKRCLPRRPDLRVVITSATIDPKLFVDFFSSVSSCPIKRVSGRAFPVDVVWEDSDREENEFENYIDAAVDKAIHIHLKEPPGDILIFLTSASEIQKCCDSFQQRLRDHADSFQCFPLHGQLQAEDQQRVFEPLQGGKRKVVFATNCAETSITIDGIKYVVDTGVAKEMVFNAKKSINALVVTTISQSSAEQRKGRAGRTAPGKCYRLYSQRSYRAMDSISLPEILKTHLGHALLKLAELGVTPDMYDFVQSPSQDSIDVALNTLHCLGAMDSNAITDVGRWIARLPFDPKLGRMMLYGHESGLLYDAIVLASLATAGSGLFYRGATQESMKKLDKVRLKFSHAGGDMLTALEVYKSWQAVGERQRNKWCMDNSINAKVIRIARDSVKDVVQLLRREVRMEVTEQFSNSADTPDKLRKMIFLCNASNLCHYLGKERIGYFAAQASRQVHIHPSSAMFSLASCPRWVVYDQLLQTSRDFITGITPVDDAWLQEVGREQYGFDLDRIRQKKMTVVFTQPAGSHVFFCMVGKSYAKLRRYEEMITRGEDNSVVVAVEASRETSDLKVFSTDSEDSVKNLTQELTGIVQEAVLEVCQEVRELTIGSEDKGLRVVLGQGGELVDILMPHETRKIFITKPSEDASEEMIREKFEQFGDVCYIHQFPGGRNWGFVVFRTSAQAVEAGEMTKEDDCNVGELEHRRAVKQHAQFKAKLLWCRRPCNGTGFVDISPCYMPDCLLQGHFYVDNELVKMKVSRKRPDESLFLSGLPPSATEDLIRRSLLNALGERENSQGIITDVKVMREQAGKPSNKEIKHYEKQLKTRFQSKLTASTVEVTVFLPKREETAFFSAEARFSDPIEGFAACRRLRGRVFVDSADGNKTALVDIEPIVSATLRVQRPVYDACREELDKVMKEKLNRMKVDLEVTEEKNKRGTDSLLLFLKATEPKHIVDARVFINDVITGDVLDCNAAPALRHLLTCAGRKMLKEAEKRTSAYVNLDNRKRTISIHGSTKACTEVRMQMNAYLDEVLSGTVEELVLRGDGKAPGLLKALLTNYGDDVETMRLEAGLHAINVDYRWHKLKLIGPPASLSKAKEAVEKLNSTLLAEYQLNSEQDDNTVDCAACFCPIDKGDLYRLEACAHPYCKDCIKHQVSIAVKDHNLPVLCCHDGCDRPLAWRDFNFLARKSNLKLPDLATSALSAYVLSNREKAAFCTTPDCPMVYRITSEDQAEVFLCPECNSRICTACHAQAHDGLTCAMLRSSEKEMSGVEAWVNQDKKNRRLCPSCKSPIEKTGGCNKMVCGACKAIICWLCGELFPSEKACYNHLVSSHGGIFQLNDLLYD